MIGFALFLLVFGGLVLASIRFGGKEGAQLAWIVAGGMLARILMMWLGADMPWFSGGVEGDWTGYERGAEYLVRVWERTGVSYSFTIGREKQSDVSLPVNVFAFIFYLNGGASSRLGGTSFVAGLACLTGLNLYLLAVERGVPRQTAMRATAAFLFVPSIFLYTAHMYKDGFVLALSFGALAAAVRLSDKFSIGQVFVCIVCASLLWVVRHYLLFAVMVPAAIGIVGLGTKSGLRQVAVLFVALVVLGMVVGYTDLLDTLTADAQRTFEQGTSVNVIDGNATGGSGIQFDDNDNPWSQIHLKLAYTVLSPFIWAPGSLAFQLGKLDGLLMAFSLWRISKHFPRLWREDRTATAVLLAFAVPMSVTYAAGVSNVGLIVRQRMPITAAFMLLALFTFRPSAEAPKTALVASRPVRRTLALR